MYHLFIIFLASNGHNGRTHGHLRDRLMQNYGDVFIRPVKNTSTATKVTIRPLFQNLIEMVRFSSSRKRDNIKVKASLVL